MKRLIRFSLLLSLCSLAHAQVGVPASSNVPQNPSAASQTIPAPYSLTQDLGQLQQTTQQTVNDLGHLKLSKWKTDERVKSETQSNIDSLQRNLTAALPGLIQQVQANPTSVAAGIRLYRNLNAVYDVLASVSESAGAFGSKDEYRGLATDTSNVDNARRQIADQLEQLASAQEQEFARLQAQVRAQQAAAQAAPPKKVVIDDNEPAPTKKTSKPTKKKATAPKSSNQSDNSNSPQ